MQDLIAYLDSVGTLVRHCANPRCTRSENGQIHLRYNAPTTEFSVGSAGERQRRLKVYCTTECKQEAATRKRSLETAIRRLDAEIVRPSTADGGVSKEVLRLWRRRIRWELDGIATRTVLSGADDAP